MWQIDELNGHNEEIRRLLSEQIAQLSAMTESALLQRLSNLKDVAGSAGRHGVIVPEHLIQFLDARI